MKRLFPLIICLIIPLGMAAQRQTDKTVMDIANYLNEHCLEGAVTDAVCGRNLTIYGNTKHVAALFCKYAQDLLLDGYRLHLNGLGTLYLTCHSTGVTDKTQLMVKNRPTRLLQLSTKVLTDKAFARIKDKVKFRIVPHYLSYEVHKVEIS